MDRETIAIIGQVIARVFDSQRCCHRLASSSDDNMCLNDYAVSEVRKEKAFFS